jgi:hypothetical protein
MAYSVKHYCVYLLTLGVVIHPSESVHTEQWSESERVDTRVLGRPSSESAKPYIHRNATSLNLLSGFGLDGGEEEEALTLHNTLRASEGAADMNYMVHP